MTQLGYNSQICESALPTAPRFDGNHSRCGRGHGRAGANCGVARLPQGRTVYQSASLPGEPCSRTARSRTEGIHHRGGRAGSIRGVRFPRGSGRPAGGSPVAAEAGRILSAGRPQRFSRDRASQGSVCPAVSLPASPNGGGRTPDRTAAPRRRAAPNRHGRRGLAANPGFGGGLRGAAAACCRPCLRGSPLVSRQ